MRTVLGKTYDNDGLNDTNAEDLGDWNVVQNNGFYSPFYYSALRLLPTLLSKASFSIFTRNLRASLIARFAFFGNSMFI